MANLTGIYPPIVTPFKDDEEIAFDRLEENLGRWIATPLDGIVVPGSNSEAIFLTAAERIELWRVCAQALRGANKRFITGTGAETTRQTIELTLTAADLGAEATLIIPPSFYKAQLTHDALLAHYRAVADCSPIPLLVYNVPAFTGIDFASTTLIALAEHPRIVGMKDSSSNILKVSTVLAARPDFQVFAGTGGALLPFMSVGAAGGIMALANFAAVPLRRLYDAFRTGRLDEARRMQLALVNINTAVTGRYGVAGLKHAMDLVGYYGGPTRRPLLPLQPEAKAEIDSLVAGLLDSGAFD